MRLGNLILLMIPLLMLQPILLLNSIPEGNFSREISEGKVAVMFWSKLCSTCEEVMPYWIELERNPPDGVKVIDVELIPGKTDELFLELGIAETPTFVLFADGREVKRFSGRPGEDPGRFLREWIMGREQGAFLIGEVLPFSLLGGLISLSPCSLPLMLSLSSLAGLSNRKNYALCFLMTASGVLALGSVALVTFSLAIWLVKWATLLLAAAAISLGAYALILPGRACRLPDKSFMRHVKGGPLACFSAGLLMIQCNFPLLMGSLILLGSMRDVLRGVLGLASLSVSLSLVLLLLTVVSRRLSASFTRGLGRAKVTRLGGLLLIALGMYVMLI